MKKILLLVLLFSLVFSCNDDDELTGIAVSFFPMQVAEAVEEDGMTYRIQLEASGIVGENEAFADVSVSMTNEGAIFTSPDLNNGTIRVPISMQVVDGRTQSIGVIEVTVLNDAIPFDYEVQFEISGTGGAISSISNANTFTLKVEDNDTAPIFFDDFENGLGQWTIINVGGDNTWATTEFDDNTSALASTFNSGDPGSEDNWLISPAIDFSQEMNETLSFLSKTRFNDEENRLEVSILNNFDGSNPLDATQTILQPTLDPHTGGGFGDFTESGDLDLSTIEGTGHIAFRFKAVNDQDASGWEVDDVELNAFDPDGSGGGSGNGNGGGNNSDGITSLSEDFESYPDAGADFTPFAADGWLNFTEAGTRAWVIDDEDGNKQVEFTAFNSNEVSNVGWLVLPKIDFDGLSNKTITFLTETQFGDDNTQLDLLYSSDFDGTTSGIATASWSEINFTVAAGSTTGFVSSGDVNLSAYSGEGYLAFRYSGDGTNDQNDATYVIDEIVLGDPGSGGGGTGGGSQITVLDEQFDAYPDAGGDFTPFAATGWLNVAEAGSRFWLIDDEDGNKQIEFTAFNSDDPSNIGWLILPEINFDGLAEAIISFDTETQFGDDNTLLQLFHSSDFNGTEAGVTSASWTEIAFDEARGTDGAFVPSGNLSLSAFTGTGYLAFRYSGDGTNDQNDATYVIDNILLGTSTSGGGGGGGGGGSSNALFEEDFDNLADGEVPSDWVSFSVLNNDLNWGSTQFGNNGTRAITANGFAGSSQDTDDWLITPSVDLDANTGEEFHISIDRRFDGPDIELLYSSNYSGSGDPTSASWSAVPGFSSPEPANANGVWNVLAPIDISGLAGSSVYFALRYTSSPSAGSSRYNIDDVSVTAD